MKARLRAWSKRVSSITVASVFAFGILAAAAPVFLSQKAEALSGVTYTDVSLDSGWSMDRTTPSGGYGPTVFDGRDVMQLRVDAPTGASSSFYQFEGIQKSIAASQSIKADLYIDSNWPTNVRAGIWGGGYSGSSIVSYPIIEYNTSMSSNWRLYDSALGAWREISVNSATTGWNTIELIINKTDASKADVYVNNTLVGQTIGYSIDSIQKIYLNNFNFGTDDYSVNWSNIQTGLRNPDAPTGLKFYKGSSEITSGSTVNYTNIVMKWNTVPNTERYQVRVTSPDGTQQSDRYTGWYTFSLDDANRYGFFGSQQGEWKYEVRAKSSTTGLWSSWSNQVTLNYDSLAPEISSITANGRQLALDGSSKVSAKNGVVYQVKATDPSGFGYIYLEMNKNLIWKAANTGGSTTTLSTSANKYNDGQEYGLKICPVDKLGNGHCTQVYFTIDNTDPTMMLREGQGGPVIDSGSVLNNTGKNIRIDKDNTDTIHAIKPSGSTWTGGKKDPSYSGGKLSLDWLFTEQGQYTFYVEDEAGNVSPNYYITIDSINPTANITSPALNEMVGGNTLTIKGTANDANFKEYKYYVKNLDTNQILGNNGWSKNSITPVEDGVLGTWDISGLPSGNYTISLNVWDSAGNHSWVGRNFTIDHSGPTIPEILEPTTNQYLNGTSTPNTWTEATDPSGIAQYEVKYVLTTGTAYRYTTTNSRTQTFTGNYQGPITISVRAQDNLENWGEWSDEVTYFYDSIAPVLTPDPTSPSVVTGNSVVPNITIDDDTGVTYLWVGDLANPEADSAVISDPTELNPTFTGTTVGHYKYTLTATDQAGNVSNEVTFEFDVEAAPVEETPNDDQTGDNGGTSTQNQPPTVVTNPTTTTTGTPAVLGASTTTPNNTDNQTDNTNNNQTEEVLGDSTNDTDEATNDNGGLAWYWWVLIALAAIFLGWLLAFWRSRSDEN